MAITIDRNSKDARVKSVEYQNYARQYAQLYGERNFVLNDNNLGLIESFITKKRQAEQAKKAELARQEDRKLQEAYRNRLLAREDRQLAQQQANWQKQLDFNKAQAEDTKKYRETQLSFQQTESEREQAYREKVLARDETQRQEDLAHRALLIQREDEKTAYDRAERERVQAAEQKRFDTQLAFDKERHDENLAFQKKNVRRERKLRLRAEAQAEAGTRQKVLATLGYGGTVDRGKISSPVEELLIRSGRQRRTR